MSHDEFAVRVAETRRLADEYALVLATAGIDGRLEAEGGGWAVLVPSALAEQARAALDAYDHDAAHPQEEAEPPRSAASLVLSAVILAVT